MPAIPAVWLPELTVNTVTDDFQGRPRITHLANGNILVVWDSTGNTGAGAPNSRDVIGQLFDPLGERFGDEFLVNVGVDAVSEGTPDIAALPDGGFLSVYHEVNGSMTSIRLSQFDPDSSPFSVSIQDDTNNIVPEFFFPRVAVSSGTSALIVYKEFEVGGGSRIAGRIYDPETGTVGAQFDLINPIGNTQNTSPSVAVLGNDNYVIACATVEADGDNTIRYRIVDAAGGDVLGITVLTGTDSDGALEVAPEVTALTGGGFVITWRGSDINGSRIEAQVFNDAGVEQGGVISVFLSTQQNAFGEPDVVALPDGGFLVLHETTSSNSLRGTRFDAAGQIVTTIDLPGNASGIDAELLDDGRVALTYVNGAGEIALRILDTRDEANAFGVYIPQDWQIGTIGDDTITSDGDVFFVAGHDGNDTITTGGPEASYFGGAGHDGIIVADPIAFDVYDGGAGDRDYIDWSGSAQIGATFNLADGTVTDGVATETMVGFEDLFGTTGDDSVIGSDGVNILRAGSGADTVDGGDGGDFLFGDGGDDTLFGGAGNDEISGNAGFDRLFGGQHDDTLAGGDDDDALFGGNGADALNGDDGNDTLTGGDGADQMFGGANDDLFLSEGEGVDDESFGGTGNDYFLLSNTLQRGDFDGGADNDTIDASAVVSGIALNISLFGIYTQDGKQFNLLGVENAIGGQQGDFMTGDDGANSLNGQGGADSIDGGGGDDELHGGMGNDTMTGGSGVDTMFGGEGDDRFLATGDNQQQFVDQNNGDAGNDTFVLSDNFFTGNINGGAGTGDHLDASLVFNFRQIVNLKAQTFDDGTSGDVSFSVINVENVTGGQRGDTITGSAVANVLDGQAGLDVIDGDAGNDTLFGGVGNDTLNGGADTDTLFGGANDDTLLGGTGRDSLSGGTGNDNFGTITAATGFDDIDGGADIDRVSFAGTTDDILTTATSYQVGGAAFALIGVEDITTGSGDDTVNATAAMTRIDAGDGDDLVNLASLTTTAIGGTGRDLLALFNLAGDLTINLGTMVNQTGFEDLTLGGGNDSGTGTDAANSILGGGGNDTLSGLGDTDALFGGTGNDALFGGTGRDRLSGGAGNDNFGTITAATGFDDIDGGADFDRVSFTGTVPGMVIDLTTGNYTVDGVTFDLFGIEDVIAGSGNDTLRAFGTTARVDAGAGDDRVVLAALTTSALGGLGRDSLDLTGIATNLVLNLATSALQTGFEDLVLGAGSDSATGTVGDNSLTGGGGNNTLFGGGGADALTGGDDADRLFGDDGDDRQFGGNGADTLTGGAGNDRLIGGSGVDRLLGGAGADNLVGGGGADALLGGGGVDRANGGGGADIIKGGGGADNLAGGGAVDRLLGGGAGDVLNGGGGADRLFGNAGADRLTGGKGNDVMTGNAGADVFVFGRGAGRDDVTDFRNGQDRVDLTGALTFAGLTETAIAGGVRLTITATPVHHIDLMGVTVAQIDAGDFI